VFRSEGVKHVPKWLLPTLSEILALNDPTWMVQYGSLSSENGMEEPGSRRLANRFARQQMRAEREWCGAIAALSILLHQTMTPERGRSTLEKPASQGFVLSGPVPILSHPTLVQSFSTWALSADTLQNATWTPLQLLPAAEQNISPASSRTTPVLPLLPGDPLTAEQFCLILTPWFSLVMVLGENLTGEPTFMFSFMPEVVQQVWLALRPRILLMSSHQIDELDELVEQFPPVAPDYTTVMQFSRLMLENLPDLAEARSDRNNPHARADQQKPEHQTEVAAAHCLLPETNSPDLELLQAIAHEVRTPLTTIRTLTRSLLKRTDLPAAAVKRLEMIDRECSEQIDRFGLIFRAVELETSTPHKAAMPLTRTSLTQMFQHSIPRWQQQASQRQLTLDVVLPQKMPAVVSDPTMLDQALTSLIERFTRVLPAGSHIRVEVTLAGNQLKVQLQSHADSSAADADHAIPQHYRPYIKSLGQLLMFQPETGSLSLNLAVTKNLFQALGGKLIVRERPQQGEVMTIFLPLEASSGRG
jgi:signal transduction histidine kinase